MADRRTVGALAAALIICLGVASSAPALLISVGGISVSELARALQASPVQQRGRPDPGLTAGQIRALDLRIARRDPGRIWIALVSPLTVRATTALTRALSDSINADGVVVVVAGANYHVTTSWGSGDAARKRLRQAVDRPGDSLAVQLRRTVDIFAAADAAAGYPVATSAGQTNSAQTPSSGQGSGSAGGASTGLIAGLILLALVLATAALLLGRRLLGSLRAAHLRDEQSVNLHRQAQADLARLGEDITALDIDSLIPIASAAAKDAYARAVVCYRDAQQRLRQRDDAYQFEHAQESLRRGALHMRAAERLCDGADAALAKLTKLHEQGALTDVEFGQEKRKLAAE